MIFQLHRRDKMSNKRPAYVHNAWDLNAFTSEDSFTYQERPLCFFFTMARYKFAGRLVKRTDRVLDIGCGAGIGSHLLTQFAKHVIGSDIDSQSIKNCNKWVKQPNLEFVEEDMLDPDMVQKHKGFCDVIVSIDTLEHVSKEEGLIMLRHVYEILPVGGMAIIGTPNKNSSAYASVWRKDGHIHEYRPDELIETMESVFGRTLLFSMTDETVSTSFSEMAWYLITVSTKTGSSRQIYTSSDNDC